MKHSKSFPVLNQQNGLSTLAGKLIEGARHQGKSINAAPDT
jgi:hypothetical protein